MPREKLEPFHKSILYLIPHASASEMKVFSEILHMTLIPPSSYADIVRAWKQRCHELKCEDFGIPKRFSS